MTVSAAEVQPAPARGGFKLPSAYTILFLLIVLTAIATWLIPAGSYDYQDGSPIPGTYHAVEAQPARILIDSLMAPINGMYGIEAVDRSVSVWNEGTLFGAIDVALRNTAEWSELGLTDAYFLTDSWTTHESIFQATADSPPRHRLQLWWTSVGEVWFDEVTLEEVAPPAHGRTERIVATGARNKLPNGGFEAGPAGWGSVTEVAGWGGNLNRLVGEVVEQGAHSGRRCLRIPVRQDQLETVWFDYYDLVRVPVRRPLAAHRGWISVEPGQRYALSAWLRTEPAGTPAVMRVAMAAGRGAEQTVAVTGEWQRYQSASSPARSSATPRSGPTRPRTRCCGSTT